jgi:peptide/nickel transport system substrate-binding protein
MMEDISAFQAATAGTAESNRMGLKLVKTMTENLLFIGTVKSSSPVYHSNTVKNFPDYKTASYSYYRSYPYRGPQWYIDK